jgi:hypothetical protein
MLISIQKNVLHGKLSNNPQDVHHWLQLVPQDFGAHQELLHATHHLDLFSQFEFHFHQVVEVEFSHVASCFSKSANSQESQSNHASVQVRQRFDFGFISFSFSPGFAVLVVFAGVTVDVQAFPVAALHHATGMLLFRGAELSTNAEDTEF